MTADSQWRVDVAITPSNCPAFRDRNQARVVSLPRSIWIRGTLSLLRGSGMRFIGDKDPRRGDLSTVSLRVPARRSEVDGYMYAGSTISFWYQGFPIKVRMGHAAARELIAALQDHRRS